MRLFDRAYWRLTAWYVLIIMTISLLFSAWVYNQANQELRFGLMGENVALHSNVLDLAASADSLNAAIDERLHDSRSRLLVRLISLNVIVLVAGAGLSNWLARRTMRPIEEALDAQHRFTADASHELRTPLAAMKTEIEVGLRDPKLSKQEARELLQSNLEEIDRLGNLAEGLLALTRSGEQTAKTAVPLADVAHKVSKRLRPLAAAKRIAIAQQLDSVTVRAGESSVDNILGILLDNAIKYSPSDTTITIRVYKKDGQGYLQVQDQGVGIAPKELPHVFERFYRADSARSHKTMPGHGLGLSIARKLAEDSGGSIRATSTPGKGSSFTLELPVA